jgi:Tfp pilus assembly protein FimV
MHTVASATRSRPSAVGRQSRPAKLRLTRRGRIVLTLLVTGLLLAVFSLGRFSAGAVGDPVSHRTVVVHSGDTLWSIAAQAAPSADPRVTVGKIRLLNHLDGGGVQVGQQLELP